MKRPDRIDRYELVEEVARGAFGAVYRARDVELGREVAIKLLLARHQEGDARTRFGREGEALARIQHPNVVKVHGVGEADGRPYLVLDFVEGETLDDRLARDGPLQPDEAAALIRTLALALEHVHAQGVLHRDLKPGNVLLRAEDGAVLLTDFGLAHDEASDRTRLSQTGHMLGTPGYWAPEQARGDKASLGPGTDVYGLGALYFACLTGEPPVVGESLLEVLAASEAGRIDPPSSLRPELPSRVDRVCLHALARDPADRYPTPAAFAEDLDRLSSGSSIAARHLQLLPSTTRAGLIVLLLLVAAGLLLWRGYVRPKQLEDRLARLQFLVDNHRYSEAQPLVDELVVLVPSSAQAWTLKAQIALAYAKAETAAKHVERALTNQPDYLPALMIRARARLQLRDRAGALADYDAVLAQDPDRLQALYGRSFLRWAEKDLAGSAEDLGRALELEPAPDARRLTTYGQRLFQLGRHPEAEAACDRALALLGSDPAGADRSTANRARFQRGKIRRARKNLAGAEADWVAASRLSPNSVSTWYSLAGVRCARKDLSGALRALDKALSISPRNPAALMLRGRIHETQQRLREALVDYDQLLKGPLQPRDAIAIRYRRGRVRAKLLDYKGAVRDYTAILDRQPTHRRAWVRRAEARTSLNLLVDALRDIDRALELTPQGDPDRPALLRRRETLTEMVRRQERARSSR